MNASKTMGIVDRVDLYLADSRLKPEALIRKRWAWIWMVVNLIGITMMTSIGVIHHLTPILWFGYILILLHLVALLIYPATKRFDLVINICYTIIIILAFIVMLQTGGLNNSMGFIFIGVNCAMGSVLAGKLRMTIVMFTLYCLSIITLGILQPHLRTPAYLDEKISNLFFVLDAIWVNAGILVLVILFMKDNSRYEKTEAENLRKIDEAKTLLYTNVSHEFRTPLTVILGFAEQIRQNPEKWLDKGVIKIRQQSHILLNLVNQMLEIARIEAGGVPLNFIHGDIKKFVIYVADSFRSLTESRNISLNLKTNDTPLYTDYDPEKLMQILGNLISNAVKFTSSGGNIDIEVSGINDGKQNMVRIVVRDDGKGISVDEIEKIFDRFYQVSEKQGKATGTGLGLAISLELVKLMNGHINVDSSLGEGSAFVVSLPVKSKARKNNEHGISLIHSGFHHSALSTLEKENFNLLNRKFSSTKPVLLIVEDNVDLKEYLVTILGDLFSLELASNGTEGLEKALEVIPDIILTDIMMPEMDGFEMLRRLKDDIRTDHIPAVALTAKGDFRSKITGLELGADHYLTKPFSEEELLLKLNNLLEARQKMQKKLGAIQMVKRQTNSQYRQEMQFMAHINNLIDEQLHNEEFGVQDICKTLNLSRSQFYRKFTALTDNSIGKYIRSYRLHKAKELIENKEKNITEAAYESGFKNLSHFSSVFRDEFGFPPSQLL